jgi:hypothetical protein
MQDHAAIADLGVEEVDAGALVRWDRSEASDPHRARSGAISDDRSGSLLGDQPAQRSLTVDQLAENIRTGTTTPKDALALMKANRVLVWPRDDDPTSWGEVEDRGASASGIHHSLAVVGASELSDQFSAEVARLRDEGRTIE